MSSDVITRVEAFFKKADELAEKGHLLRAAENFGRAAEAARPLGSDNLVTLDMQMQRGKVLCFFALNAPDATDARDLASHRSEFIALLSGAVAALERRRAAGTLLEGRCNAAEEAWSATRWLQQKECTAAMAAFLAPLVGYEAFIHAAGNASGVLARAHRFAAECSAAQFQSFVEHAVHAAELMQQPRLHGNVPMQLEARFTAALRRAVSEEGAHGLDARLKQLLADTWQRLQRSGVLEVRGIEKLNESMMPTQRAFGAIVHKSLYAPGLRRCALPGCGAKEAHPTHFKSCAACRTVVYCCREHQVAGWPSHKKACKAVCKAAEEEDGAGPSGA